MRLLRTKLNRLISMGVLLSSLLSLPSQAEETLSIEVSLPAGHLAEGVDQSGLARATLYALIDTRSHELAPFKGELSPIIGEDDVRLKLTLPVQNRDQGLSWLSHALLMPQWSEEAIARRSQIARSRFLSQLAHPNTLGDLILRGALFNRHPYGNLARPDQPLTAQTLQSFYHQYYQGIEVRIQGEENPSFLGEQKTVETPLVQPLPVKQKRYVCYENTREVLIRFGGLLPTRDHEDWPAIALVHHILTADDVGRLSTLLANKHYTTAFFASDLHRFEQAGYWQMSISSHPNSWQAAFNLVVDQMRLIGSRPVNAEEWQAAKQSLMASESDPRLLAKIADLTPRQAQLAARRYWDDQLTTSTVIGSSKLIKQNVEKLGRFTVLSRQQIANGEW